MRGNCTGVRRHVAARVRLFRVRPAGTVIIVAANLTPGLLRFDKAIANTWLGSDEPGV
jgi:hypothetical protein